MTLVVLRCLKSRLNNNLSKLKKNNKNLSTPHAVLIGLDKITAKSSKIKIKLEEAKKFGPLEIKILKCGKVEVNNKLDDVIIKILVIIIKL